MGLLFKEWKLTDYEIDAWVVNSKKDDIHHPDDGQYRYIFTRNSDRFSWNHIDAGLGSRQSFGPGGSGIEK